MPFCHLKRQGVSQDYNLVQWCSFTTVFLFLSNHANICVYAVFSKRCDFSQCLPVSAL